MKFSVWISNLNIERLKLKLKRQVTDEGLCFPGKKIRFDVHASSFNSRKFSC